MPDCQGNKNGLFINLHNNLWNTGFPIYYDQDAKFRFQIELLPGSMKIIDKTIIFIDIYVKIFTTYYRMRHTCKFLWD